MCGLWSVCFLEVTHIVINILNHINNIIPGEYTYSNTQTPSFNVSGCSFLSGLAIVLLFWQSNIGKV